MVCPEKSSVAGISRIGYWLCASLPGRWEAPKGFPTLRVNNPLGGGVTFISTIATAKSQ